MATNLLNLDGLYCHTAALVHGNGTSFTNKSTWQNLIDGNDASGGGDNIVRLVFLRVCALNDPDHVQGNPDRTDDRVRIRFQITDSSPGINTSNLWGYTSTFNNLPDTYELRNGQMTTIIDAENPIYLDNTQVLQAWWDSYGSQTTIAPTFTVSYQVVEAGA